RRSSPGRTSGWRWSGAPRRPTAGPTPPTVGTRLVKLEPFWYDLADPRGQEGQGGACRDCSRQEIRAMDRRRYTPSAEGLEGRQLLSGLFGGKSSQTNTTVSVADLPETYRQKENRLFHLPIYL